MGYKIQPKTATFIFEGTEYAGVEVVTRLNVTLRVYRDIVTKASGIDSGDAVQALDAIDSFAPVLLSWNLEDDDGNPIPANLAGLQEVTPNLIALIISEWMQAVQAVPAPLAAPSENGRQAIEPSLSN